MADFYLANHRDEIWEAMPLGINLIHTLVTGSATVADSVGNTFEPRRIRQQAPSGTSQYYTSPIYRPTPSMDDQSYGTGLSQGAIQKIQEFKVLINKYPQYHTNPDAIIRLAIYNSINGDNTLLDDKLEQLRTIDSLAKFYVGPS